MSPFKKRTQADGGSQEFIEPAENNSINEIYTPEEI